MNEKWLIGFATIFILASIIVNIIEYNDPLGLPDKVVVDGEEVCTTATCYLNDAIQSFNRVSSGEYSEIVPLLRNFMTAFGHMMIWDYNFLKVTPWHIVRWALLFPITLGLIVSLAVTLVGIVRSLAQALGSILPW